ncbi:pantoate--beta-alanine ligase [Ornithinibacillus halophilus]|uniref:Pantothenate synthetase n=1 Tax=Ornithinibacillus halophilus TaxID=930117 RepID=A0A1M5J502_9BACI|nr:pantoate--beta-alanine ligase [Ornithinibacillus halophilus]SHG35654.1 pantoate--beta-alanine ligase [Ornithinibacillus halophilus]
MKIVSTIEQVKNLVNQWKSAGQTIGFVPTMGFLHEGHGSLITSARQQNEKVVVSIFVNPLQFGPTEDYDSYPHDIERDRQICEELGADVIFHPTPEEMYPKDFYTYVDMSGLTEGLCGDSRPGHFRGVCTVVNKLFNIVQPNRAYFGQKDAQQLAIIKQMATDLNMNVEVIGCPIIREEDGLAKSSRNAYLSSEERKAAQIVSKAIFAGEELVKSGEIDAEKIVTTMKNIVDSEPLAKVEYVNVVDGLTLKPVATIKPQTLVAMAVHIGKTRLIDNFIVE